MSLSARPCLDALEDRYLPSILLPAPPADGGRSARLARGAAEYRSEVTVIQNAPPTVLDVVALLRELGVANADERSLYVVGNSNPGLVRARLSDDDLTLTYASGQTGTADITIDAVDAAGASVRLVIRVTVTAGPVVASANDAALLSD